MNIKDSYIHGDLAVVRSIEGLSVSNDGNLVLKYKKADSDSTEETKSIAISSFNSALSNKFVTLDTNQAITGLKIFNSNYTGFNTSTREITGNPLIIGRYSSANEALHIGVDDNTVYFIHRQDETESSFSFIGTWDDIEKGGGANAGYKRIDFVMNQTSDPYISINGNKVWHEGNDGAGSGLHADFLDGHHGSYYAAATSLGDYLPLSGGTMTGSIGYKRNTTGGEAGGLFAYGKNSDSISGGIGFLWNNDHEDEPYIFLATKTTYPWRSTNGLMITSSNITWKENKILTSSDVSGGGNSWGSSLTVDGKTLTIPSNPNTDYQVKQSNKTDNVYYPILLGGNYNATAASIATADKTSQVYQNSGVYVNASTKTIYASTFSGSFSGNSTTSTLTKYTLTSSSYHLVGVNENLTSTATARSAIGRNDVLVTASGAIQAVDTAGFNFGTSATMKYNTTNQSIDFIFN